MRTDELKNALKTNGAKFKGPTTEVGKAKSAANANRHNLSGDRFMLLSTEDPIAYVEHIKYYVERFQPADPVERDLVDRLIAASWRDKRMDSMEASLFANSRWKNNGKTYLSSSRISTRPRARRCLSSPQPTCARR